MAVGVKETQELLKGLTDIAVAVKKVLNDGQLNLADLPTLLGLLTKVNELVAAVEGLDQIPLEVKDLTGEEINLLVGQVLDAVNLVKAA